MLELRLQPNCSKMYLQIRKTKSNKFENLQLEVGMMLTNPQKGSNIYDYFNRLSLAISKIAVASYSLGNNIPKLGGCVL